MSAGLVLDRQDVYLKGGASGVTQCKNYYGEITSKICP